MHFESNIQFFVYCYPLTETVSRHGSYAFRVLLIILVHYSTAQTDVTVVIGETAADGNDNVKSVA